MYRGWSSGKWAGALFVGCIGLFVLWVFVCLWLSLGR